MLVTLTPDLVEIERRKLVAIEHNFEYIPQSDNSFIIEPGIYRCAYDHNFSYEEFIEKIKDNLNEEILNKTPLPDNFNELYINRYGVADTIEQIKEYYKTQIADTKNKYVISVTPVFQDPENKYKGGGWRWHKWGEYIGTLDSQCEYLDDEDFGSDFKYVICFQLYKVL